MFIYVKNSSKKKSKPNAKQRELKAEWEAMLQKYPVKQIASNVTLPKAKTYQRETIKYPSLNSGYHDCSKKPNPVYTGTKVKGIGTMHKSNAVPIFSDEEAMDIARMRRG
jgi:hypothetical protein